MEIIPTKQSSYQELLPHKYFKWLMMSWDTMELIECIFCSRDFTNGKDYNPVLKNTLKCVTNVREEIGR